MKQKTILVSENVHKILKNFCNENSIKINGWVEKLIINELKKKSNVNQ